MPLTNQQLLDQSHKLAELLMELKAGMIDTIEYGVDGQPGGYYSHLRIRWMRTAGGMQFGLKRLSPGGIEGSGEYSPSASDIAVLATQAMAHYHRPTSLRWKLKTQPPELTWFAFREGTQRMIPRMCESDFENRFGGEAVTLTV